MMIQILLSTMLAVVAVYALGQKRVWWPIRFAFLTCIAVGFVFVWFPDWTNVVAAMMGVTRGADLLFYIWIVLSFGVVFFLYLKLVHVQRALTEVVRLLAIEHAVELPRTVPSVGGTDERAERL